MWSTLGLALSPGHLATSQKCVIPSDAAESRRELQLRGSLLACAICGYFSSSWADEVAGSSRRGQRAMIVSRLCVLEAPPRGQAGPPGDPHDF